MLPEIKEKMKQTTLKNHGVEFYAQKQIVKDEYKRKIETGEEGNVKRMLERIKDTNIHFIKHEHDKILFHCDKCNSDFRISSFFLCSRIKNNTEICLNCNKNKSYSNIVKLVQNKLNLNNFKYKVNNRNVLSGKEIDIYFPNQKLGIEINGLYWHSEKYKTNNYHIDKTNLAKDNGIDLLHFFEDEITYKLDIVISIIKNRLNSNKINIVDDYFIKEINSEIFKDFLLKNSLDDLKKSDLYLGLFKNQELISIMSLKTKKRFEIINAADKINSNFENILKLFIIYIKNNFIFKEIVVKLDIRYSNIKPYLNLDFKHIKTTKPKSYHYYPPKLIRLKKPNKNKEKKCFMICDCGEKILKLKNN